MKVLSLAVALSSLALVSCGPQTAEDVRAASTAKCERQFGKMASSPEKGKVFCGCLVDRLAESGMEVTDMLGGDQEKVMETAKSCARTHGIPIPS